jgi:NAD(P)-dependent dehydrogenase (short-subunit alcohol dehydrogenase family)
MDWMAQRSALIVGGETGIGLAAAVEQAAAVAHDRARTSSVLEESAA